MSNFDLLHLAWWQLIAVGLLFGFGQAAGAWVWGVVVTNVFGRCEQ